MAPDPDGRRTPRAPACGVATVRRAGTVYACTPNVAAVQPGTLARVVLTVAGVLTGMVGGGLLLGMALAAWLGV